MASLESVKASTAGEENGASSAQPQAEEATTAEARALAAIATANQEFRIKTDSLFTVPLAVLLEQRNSAIIALEEAKAAIEGDRSKLIAEQDQFIAFLTEDHQGQLATIEQQLSQAKLALERQAVLTPVIHAPLAGGGESELRKLLDQAEAHNTTLREQLENAYREVDESRRDGWRLQEERDEAIRTTDDLRLEWMNQTDSARDETARLQLELDNAQRALEDVRDEAREEASRTLEDMESLKTELDERRAEVTRLRERLEEGSDYRPSQPPPPPASDELDRARAEAKVVRKQLIDAKREISRLTRELELARAQRGPLYRHTPSGGIRPQTRTGTTQPGMTEAKAPPSVKNPPPSGSDWEMPSTKTPEGSTST